ncbi:DUF7379 domain-containing protein [Paraburkholderia humisilvae]|uniref:Uncharacterized protein n=1 Tax=Paraburkholderia humisilvae TaxID=627669 RepID=A0A6J5EYH7_9BURK|nr:CHAT domain-containing protein [Paraburkholderia humisilvae]CAB3770096.1 hypothetical protein LMG29542_06263 [Paraburkholderia humisilvae]
MASHRTASGIEVTFPDGIDLEELPDASLAGGIGVRGPLHSDDLSDLFDVAGFERDDAIQLTLAPGATAIAVEPVEMNVPIEPDRHAVVLVERDGALSWRYPEDDTPGESGAVHVRGTTGTLRFRLDPSPEPDDGDADTRGWIHDIIADWLASQIRVYVLRFAARSAVETLTPWLERDVSEGIVRITGYDPAHWVHGDAPPIDGRPRKVLLLVHGTFSNTRGSFGALCGEQGTGLGILAAVLAKYDLVIGFDHRTLTENPLQNAEKLAQALLSLNLADDAELDAIAFSRGGLVLRYLTERVLPQRQFPLIIRRLVFVGCTNGGTNLARPENWKRMLDIYTNLVLAGTHAAGWIPGFGTGAAIASETVKSISEFVQDIAAAAADEVRVPGIAAMQPDSEYVRDLNESPIHPGTLATTRYYRTGAAFQIDQGPAPGFADGVRDYLMYHVANRLFNDANDLVVDCAMMSEFGCHASLVQQASHPLSSEERIYHTIYFTSAELCDLLGEWLLDTPALYSRVHTGVQVIDGDTSAPEAARSLSPDLLAPVVVLERRQSEVFYHLTRVEELATLLDTPQAVDMSVTEAIRKHDVFETFVESDERELKQLDDVWTLGNPAESRPQRGAHDDSRRVVLVNGTVVGVVPDAVWALELKKRTDTFGGVRGAVAGAAGAAGSPDDFNAIPMPDFAWSDTGSLHGVVFEGVDPRAGAPVPALPRQESVASVPIVPPPATFDCQFEAEMRSRPRLVTPASVLVHISREIRTIETGATHGSAVAPVAEVDPIVVTVRAIHNCAIAGEAQATVAPPEAGVPRTLTFVVRGIAEGEAELWVSATQAGRRLVTIPLCPSFIAETEQLVVQATASLDGDEGALIDLRIRDTSAGNESDVQLQYDLSSDELTVMVEEESVKLDGQRRLDYIAGIYADIERYWLTAARASRSNPERVVAIMEDFQEELRLKGMALCEQLIPVKVRKALWDAYIQNRVGAVRVLTKEPSIPWEMLYLRDPDKILPPSQGCFLADLGLLRWNAALGYPPPRISIDPARAFYLIPDYPAPYTLPSTTQDRALLKQLFQATELQATKRRMSKLFDSERFDLFHAGCHGEARRGRPWESGLLLEVQGPTGGPDYLRPHYLQGVANGSRPFVFLNACQVGMQDDGMTGAAGLGQAFLETCKASILVAPMWSVRDQTASLFARNFYEKLAGGATLVCAVRHARRTAKAAGDPSWLAYSVWGHPFARIEVKRAIQAAI